MFMASTAVVMAELMKIVISLLLLLWDAPSWASFKSGLLLEYRDKPQECMKLLVPGLLYTTQNNLQYTASSNLEPAVFQVMYQVKMLTTALLSVFMLKKRLGAQKWLAVGACMLGLVLVQLSQRAAGGVDVAGQNQLLGFVAILMACTMSGFAGCYLERVLKGCDTSIWIRNLQLGTWGTLLGLLSVLVKDGQGVRERGFFSGYTPFVWLVISIQACGGLLISLVVRYGDALMKGFATGLAIIVTTVASIFFFGFVVTPQYLAGASLVFSAILLYSNVDVRLLLPRTSKG